MSLKVKCLYVVSLKLDFQLDDIHNFNAIRDRFFLQFKVENSSQYKSRFNLKGIGGPEYKHKQTLAEAPKSIKALAATDLSSSAARSNGVLPR